MRHQRHYDVMEQAKRELRELTIESYMAQGPVAQVRGFSVGPVGGFEMEPLTRIAEACKLVGL